MLTRKTEILSMCALALCCAACSRENHAKRVFRVNVATSPESCGDGSNIVAIALGGHRARLNAEPEASIVVAAQRLHEIMSYRAEKVVYVKAETHVSWGEFLELIERVWPEVNVVSILTPQVEASARRNDCLAPSCHDCSNLGDFGRACVERRFPC
jgi:hypothetical protein